MKNLILTILFISLISCSQSIKLTITDGKEPDIANAEMKTKPIFTQYLQDLDLFSGIESEPNTLPSLITDYLASIKEGSSSYTEEIAYASHQFYVKYDFSFKNITNFLGSKYSKKYLSKIISSKEVDGKTELTILFNNQTRALFDDDFEFLSVIDENPSKENQSIYLSILSRIIASTPDNQAKALNEIENSAVFVSITFPRPVISASEGNIADREWNTIFLLKDLLYPYKPNEITITY